MIYLSTGYILEDIYKIQTKDSRALTRFISTHIHSLEDSVT